MGRLVRGWDVKRQCNALFESRAFGRRMFLKDSLLDERVAGLSETGQAVVFHAACTASS